MRWPVKCMVCLVAFSVALTAHAGDYSRMCKWFGIGCPEGEQNAVLMDLGRQNTNTGFLFFGGDTAVVERTLELTFSSRSIAKGDKLKLQVEANGLPPGASVTLDGRSCLAPEEVEIRAEQNRQRVTLKWVVPPTGEDVDLTGTVKMTPYGFDRAGSMPLAGKQGVSLEMLRVQGEVDDDWHLAKRLTFWFWAVTLTSLCLWKFFLAPVFFHRRLRVHKVRLRCFEAGGRAEQALFDTTVRHWGKTRKVWLTGQRMKRSPWKDFLHGRTVILVMDCLEDQQFKLLKGGTSKRRGLKMQVLRKQGARFLPSSVYSKLEPAENQVHFEAAGKPLILQFEFD